jgi:hypothetical protein
VYFPKYRDVIERIARKLSYGSDELRQDLIQEGSITLWKLDPGKATVNEDAWIRQAIAKRMMSYLRREQPKRYQSLDAELEAGWELQETANGERFLSRDKDFIDESHRYRIGED